MATSVFKDPKKEKELSALNDAAKKFAAAKATTKATVNAGSASDANAAKQEQLAAKKAASTAAVTSSAKPAKTSIYASSATDANTAKQEQLAAKKVISSLPTKSAATNIVDSILSGEAKKQSSSALDRAKSSSAVLNNAKAAQEKAAAEARAIKEADLPGGNVKEASFLDKLLIPLTAANQSSGRADYYKKMGSFGGAASGTETAAGRENLLGNNVANIYNKFEEETRPEKTEEPFDIEDVKNLSTNSGRAKYFQKMAQDGGSITAEDSDKDGYYTAADRENLIGDKVTENLDKLDYALKKGEYETRIEKAFAALTAEYIYTGGVTANNLAKTIGAMITASGTNLPNSSPQAKAINQWVRNAGREIVAQYESGSADSREYQSHASELLAEAGEGAGALGKFALDATSGINSMLVATAYGKLLGFDTATLFGISGGAQKAADMIDEGYDPFEAAGAGLAWGVIEKEIEAMGGFGQDTKGVVDIAAKKIGDASVKLLGKTVSGETVASVVRLASSPAAKFIFGSTSEGVEEMLEYDLEYALDYLFGRAGEYSVKDKLYNGLVGFTCGTAFELTNAAVSRGDSIGLHLTQEERADKIKAYLDSIDPKILDAAATGNLDLVEEAMKGITDEQLEKATIATDTLDEIERAQRIILEYEQTAAKFEPISAEENQEAVSPEEKINPAQKEIRAEDGSIWVGKATKIKNPYKGPVPTPTAPQQNRVEIGQDAFAEASEIYNNFSKEKGETGAGAKLGKALEKILERIGVTGKELHNVVAENVEFEGTPYTVTVNKNIAGKLAGDGKKSAEKFAVLSNIDNVIKNSGYVGSGEFFNHGNKNKAVIRYDYFETEATINGKPYFISFDVSVIPGRNNYRTHKVINEINLTENTSGETGPEPAAQVSQSGLPGDVPSPSSNVAQNEADVKPNSVEEETPAGIKIIDELTGKTETKAAAEDTGSETQRLGNRTKLQDSAKRVQQQAEAFSSGQKSDVPKTEILDEAREKLSETQKSIIDKGNTPTKKSKDFERRYVRKLSEAAANIFGDPKIAEKETLRPIIAEIAETLKNGGTVTDEQLDRIYKAAYDAGIIEDSSEFEGYKKLRDKIKGTKLYFNEDAKADFGDDAKRFIQSQKGKLSISASLQDFRTGRAAGIDGFYSELRNNGLADRLPDTNDPKQQFENLANFMATTERQFYGLDDFYGGDIEFETWAKGELRKAADKFAKSMSFIENYEDERTSKANERAKKIDPQASAEKAVEAFNSGAVFEAEKALNNAKSKNILTDSEKITVEKLLNGSITAEQALKLGGNISGIVEVADAQRAYNNAIAPFTQYKKALETSREAEAFDALSGSDDAKDKANGILYSRETAERNNLDVFGEAEGQEINDKFFKPVHEHRAQATNWKENYQKRWEEAKIGHLNKFESAYTQMLGENAKYLAEGKITKHNEHEHEALTEKMQELLDSNGSKIDKAKCEKAAGVLLSFYNEIWGQLQDANILSGYKGIGKIENYFPHFQDIEPSTVGEKILDFLGLYSKVEILPTEISGRTAGRKPGTKYNPHTKTRTSDATTYDAVKGFDLYLEAAAQNIFLTEDIQRLRTLDNSIRTKYTKEDVDAEVAKVRASDIAEDAKDAAVEQIYDRAQKLDRYQLTNYVNWLDNYTNILAGKKSYGDREAEFQMGRKMYDAAKGLEGRIASNMIGYNASTAATNFIPLFQATADIPAADIVKALLETAGSSAKGDAGIVANSSFLTNRRGIDSFEQVNGFRWNEASAKDIMKKIADGGAIPMAFVDNIVSETLVRARTEQNLSKGLDINEAIKEADFWAAGLMADRSQGALPTVFEMKNPIVKALSMFQVEQNNQFSYFLKDAGKYKAWSEGKAKTVIGQTKFLVAMFICNILGKALLGRDDLVPDPIGLGFDVYNDIKDGKNPADIITGTASEVIQQTPFIGGLLGGGRIPISSAIADPNDIANYFFNTEMTQEEKNKLLLESLLPSAGNILLPSGAGQIKKTYQGIEQVLKGGNFGLDSSGREILKYPQSGIPDGLKAVLFGRWSTDEAQDYIDRGFKGLSAKETSGMKAAENLGIDRNDFFDAVFGLKDYKKEADKQIALFGNPDLSQREKNIIDSILFGNAKSPEQAGSKSLNLSAEKTETVLDTLTNISGNAALRDAIRSLPEEFTEAEKREIERLYTKATDASDRAKNYAKNEIPEEISDKVEKILNYGSGLSKDELIDKIQTETGENRAKSFALYSMANGTWKNGAEDLKPDEADDFNISKKFFDFSDCGVSMEDLYTVGINFGSFKDENGKGNREVAVNAICEATGWNTGVSETAYDLANSCTYRREELSEEQVDKLDALNEKGWEDERFFYAKNVISMLGLTKKDETILALQKEGFTEDEITTYCVDIKNWADGELSGKEKTSEQKTESSGYVSYDYGLRKESQVAKSEAAAKAYGLKTKDVAAWYNAIYAAPDNTKETIVSTLHNQFGITEAQAEDFYFGYYLKANKYFQ